jgi:hypothetical protein
LAASRRGVITRSVEPPEIDGFAQNIGLLAPLTGDQL